MEPISLRFRYSRAEYMQAARVHFASRLRLPVDIAVVFAVAAIGTYLWRANGQSPYAFFLLTLDAAFTIVLVFAFTLLPYLLFRNQPTLRDEYLLTFSDSDIHFKTTHLDSTLQWSIYKRVLVSTNFFLLYHGSRSFSVVPKRVLADADQQARFEVLIKRKIPIVAQISFSGTSRLPSL